jgi:hypothetical protein
VGTFSDPCVYWDPNSLVPFLSTFSVLQKMGYNTR